MQDVEVEEGVMEKRAYVQSRCLQGLRRVRAFLSDQSPRRGGWEIAQYEAMIDAITERPLAGARAMTTDAKPRSKMLELKERRGPVSEQLLESVKKNNAAGGHQASPGRRTTHSPGDRGAAGLSATTILWTVTANAASTARSLRTDGRLVPSATP